MMKKLYASAWLLVVMALVISVLTGASSFGALLGSSLAALALVYGLAVWLVISNTRDAEKAIS
jgi:hypothetical protein